MTKKDYELIAMILAKKIAEVDKWSSIECKSLTLAYAEDFSWALKRENPKFDDKKFYGYIKKLVEAQTTGKLIIG